MNFWDFLASLSWWQFLLFLILVYIWIETSISWLFSPITRRLDKLNETLKNVDKIAYIEKQEEKK